MNYRFLKLLALKEIDADQTVTIDLDMADPVSQILLDTRITSGVNAVSTEHPMAAVTKVEIIDGSEVLLSLDGFELEALDIYNNGQQPRGGWFVYLTTVVTDRVTAINFGRWLWDEILAFDPKRFSNPQLRVTFDISAGGMDPGSSWLAVYAAMFNEKAISPTGFLMAKEIKKWTGTAAAHEYTDLPTDYPYRKLLLQARKAGSPPFWCFDNIKLSEDQDKRIVVDNDFRSIMMGIGRENAFIREDLTCCGAVAAQSYHVTPTVNVVATGNGWSASLASGDISTWAGDGGYVQVICAAAENIVLHINGWCPHGTLQIPFGLQDKIEDWYDVARVGNLKLDIKDGVTGSTSKVFLQQLRTY